MENAAKALVMAGGILIAIIVIATLVYASNMWGIIPQAQDENDEVKQLAAFNQQYESYAKGALYGADLITVLNKAIDNNERYDANHGDEMYVNISFKIKLNIDTIEKQYKEYLSGPNKGKTVEDGVGVSSTTTLPAGTYTLEKNNVKIKEFLRNFSNKSSANKETDKKITDIKFGTDDDGIRYRSYKETMPDTAEFKIRIFACTEVKYNKDGRITSLIFEEQIQDGE